MESALTVDEALARIVAVARPLGAEHVLIDDADGRVLAQDIVSPLNLPPFANSAMDGYAFRSADVAFASLAAPVVLRIVDHIAAGHLGQRSIGTGEAARIMTGAPIPPGADAVLRFESIVASAEFDVIHAVNGTPSPPPLASVAIPSPVEVGFCIRAAGEDVAQGQVVLRAGMVLNPAGVGLLAALGLREVMVVRRPRVALIGTGDELVQPGDPLPPGAIYDSNDYLLASYLRRLGANVLRVTAVGDRVGALRDLLNQSVADGVDLIITSGGVSVGDFDLVKEVLRQEGQIDFWRIRMRPGKPLACGAIAGIPLLGLPGSPVAAFVGCALYARALIAVMLHQDPTPPYHMAICAEPIRNGSQKRHFLRGTLAINAQGHLLASLAGGQLPGQFSTVALSTCLIVAHEDRALYERGELIPVIPLDYAMTGILRAANPSHPDQTP